MLGLAVDVVRTLIPVRIPRADGITLDGRVLLAATLAALLTGLAAGAIPAWQASRADVVGYERATVLADPHRSRWRSVFVVAEVALASVLVTSAILLVVSFIKVTTTDLGFRPANLVAVSGAPARAGEEAIERLHRLPGVLAVAAFARGQAPLIAAGFGGRSSSVIDIVSPAASRQIAAEDPLVSAGYFETVGIRRLHGERFQDSTPRHVVIDETTARALFPGRAAVGADVKVGGEDYVVGAVVGNVLREGPEEEPAPHIYLPAAPESRLSEFVVRTSEPVPAVVPRIRAALAGSADDRRLQVRSIAEAFHNITAQRRFVAWLMVGLSGLALLIGAGGIYAVMGSVVAQRRRELAVRRAVGATTAQVGAIILFDAWRHLSAGVVIGLLGAWWSAKILSSLLFGVRYTDVWVYGMVALTLIIIGTVAAFVPARRAARVDPTELLRAG